MLTPVEEKVLENGKQEESQSQILNDIELWRNCNGNAIIFDVETSKTVCSSCGMVLKDNAESLAPEWKICSINSKARAQECQLH